MIRLQRCIVKWLSITNASSSDKKASMNYHAKNNRYKYIIHQLKLYTIRYLIQAKANAIHINVSYMDMNWIILMTSIYKWSRVTAAKMLHQDYAKVTHICLHSIIQFVNPILLLRDEWIEVNLRPCFYNHITNPLLIFATKLEARIELSSPGENDYEQNKNTAQ